MHLNVQNAIAVIVGRTGDGSSRLNTVSGTCDRAPASIITTRHRCGPSGKTPTAAPGTIMSRRGDFLAGLGQMAGSVEDAAGGDGQGLRVFRGGIELLGLCFTSLIFFRLFF